MSNWQGQQGGTGMASLNTNKIVADTANFSTVPVASMASLITNKITPSTASSSTALAADMASLNTNKIAAAIAWLASLQYQ